ncbi:hypothetical protein CCICO_05035 [Corynebacterium ciconiae DSM 44920]|uniref:GmrSD restriction endonuclease domain-containing protein n=1 Tax=Corynebacterium ciconiae TaxID=227319 RepID=UPI000374B60B|nr:DUF262 domain-containing protein [Corynebacterium ciconiae]WKD61043.1 hypothetical protein CCICO_05035 [Corynebacterium ciconiae DSM 44920]
MGFSTPSYVLTDLFARINRGDLQLPDFQRSFRWDVDRVRALILTVLRGYPIGTLMTLDVRGEPMRFKPRPLQGAPNASSEPGWLLLDGQQRLTTLFHTLSGDGYIDTIDFRRKRVRRKFYLDINKALEGDILPDEAVFSVDEHGQVQTHFGPVIDGGVSDHEAELSNEVIPIIDLLNDNAANMLFDLAARGDADTRERMKTVMNRVVRPLSRYSVPMIRLDRDTHTGGIGSIFVHANSGGLRMGVFDLLTAVFATEDSDYKLGDDWKKTQDVLSNFEVLGDVGTTDFLKAVTLLVTYRRGRASGQREDILQLTLDEYKPAADAMRVAFAQTAKFLRDRRIFTKDQVPYTSQLVALAVILAIVEDDPAVRQSKEAWDRLYRWFWCVILGELYGTAAVANRAARDVNEVPRWVIAGAHSDTAAEAGDGTEGAADGADDVDLPASVAKARFAESRLLSIDADSTAYKGIFALMMGRGAKDWRTGLEFNGENIADLDAGFHYIFPPRWCAEQGVDPVLYNSVLNRAPMGRRTQVVISGTPPSRYLPRVQSKSIMEDAEFDGVLSTSMLTPGYLHAAKAEEFFSDRRRRVLQAIEEAMGNEAIHDVDENDLRGGHEGPDAFQRPEEPTNE